MTRMMKLDRTYRVYMREIVTREVYVDIVADSFEDAEDKAYEYCDIEGEWYQSKFIQDGKMIEHEVDEIEELNTSQEQ